jgi:hypothetical protein
MPSGIYSCTLWRNQRLFGPKKVEEFETALDPRDSSSLDSALAAAAFRDRRNSADIMEYRLQVRPFGELDVIVNYVHNPVPGAEAPDGGGDGEGYRDGA